MPTIEDLKRQKKRLLDKIKEYDESADRLKNPYAILSDLSLVMQLTADVLLPSAFIPSKLLLLVSKFINAYVKRRKNADK